jgi:serine protease Do
MPARVTGLHDPLAREIDMSNSTTSRPSRRTRGLLALLLSTTILGAAGGAWSMTSQTNSVAQPPELASATVTNPAGFGDLISKARPAVVNIAVTEKSQLDASAQSPSFPNGSPADEWFRRFFNGEPSGRSNMPSGPATHALGSGFIVDPSGYIVTNNHVVDGATKIEVTLDDGSSFPATVKGRDEKTDLALLKIDAGKPLPSVTLGNADQAHIGDWVIAIGNPFGLGGTATAGIISARGRDLSAGPYDDFLQIDAPMNPGNSGGPLFDQSGHVIGVATAIYSPNGGSVGIGFAIPSNLVAKVVDELRAHGAVERGWMGVQMQPMTPALAKALGRTNAEGVIVDSVEPNSPASQASLQPGDLITALNGRAITDAHHLASAAAEIKPGSKATLTVWRNGTEHSMSLTMGEYPTDHAMADNADTQSANEPVGVALVPLTPDARGELSVPDSVKGAVVAEVTPGSLAAESGIEAGDVILKMGDKEVATPTDAAAAIRAAQHEKKEAVPLLVMREGKAHYLALQLKQA